MGAVQDCCLIAGALNIVHGKGARVQSSKVRKVSFCGNTCHAIDNEHSHWLIAPQVWHIGSSFGLLFYLELIASVCITGRCRQHLTNWESQIITWYVYKWKMQLFNITELLNDTDFGEALRSGILCFFFYYTCRLQERFLPHGNHHRQEVHRQRCVLHGALNRLLALPLETQVKEIKM